MPKFTTGNPGGPGRRRGSRNKRTLILEALAHDSAPELLEAMIRAGKAGNAKAAQLVLSRIWPERRGPVLSVALPPIKKPADLVAAQAALIAAVGRGELSADEALSLSALLENQRRALDTLQLDERLDALDRHDRETEADAARRAEPRWS